ncbi:MAG TPA: class I SAM-dependent methyltransferase [Alphaproteobacteria bacterium]|nr:class I SAM-dependent methyltransferase [Alphaproteobacteria bacterium]
MSNRSIGLSDELYRYLIENSLREPDLLHRLREETARMAEVAVMQIAPEQGQFMGLLVQLMGARRALEIGTFTGYSALSVILAMPKDGHLVCCDISKEYTDIARRYWAEAGVADRIDLRLGPAIDTLDRLIAGGNGGKFDFIFIDADKENYDGYYERALLLLRPGGLITIDNVLWNGFVADPLNEEETTRAIRRLNDKIAADKRVALSLVPIGDGLTLARKLP